MEGRLNTEGEFDADVNVARHLDDLGELDRLLGGGLQVVDGEDLEAGVVKLLTLLAYPKNGLTITLFVSKL